MAGPSRIGLCDGLAAFAFSDQRVELDGHHPVSLVELDPGGSRGSDWRVCRPSHSGEKARSRARPALRRAYLSRSECLVYGITGVYPRRVPLSPDDIAKLLEEHKEQIRRRVCQVVGWMPDCDTDDVLSETFLRIVKAGTYDGSRPFVPYAISAAVSAAFEARRKRKREENARLRYLKEKDSSSPDVSRPVDILAGRRSSELRLRRFEQFFRLVFHGPFDEDRVHQLIVFGFTKLLGWAPEKVLESQFLDTSLTRLELLFEERFIEKAGCAEEWIRSELALLRSFLSDEEELGKKKLRACFASQDEKRMSGNIYDWSHRVERSVLRRVAALDIPELVGYVVDGRLHPHEIIVYGLTQLLGEKCAKVLNARSNQPLQQLGDSIERRCLKMAPRRAGATRQAFGQLRRTLNRCACEVLVRSEDAYRYADLLRRNPPIEKTELREYFSTAPERDLEKWIDLVRGQIRESLDG
jgi:hypothetical protein